MILRRTDSYKVGHFGQYPPGTSLIHSYLESRGGMFPTSSIFGNHYYAKRYLSGVQVDLPSIDHAQKHARHHFGNDDMFNRAGWLHILEKHNGRLPLLICAPEEGTVVGTGNVLMTIENTDPAVPWLTNYVETMLMRLWYPYTVASLSHYCRNIILKYLLETGTPEEIWFKLHDFGARGVSSTESAEIGGAAHLINFKGTDTMEAIDFLFEHYSATFDDYPAFSVAASEHSTMTTWGQKHEREAYANMLDKYPTGIVSVVSDSWDIFNAVDKIWGQELKDRVLNRHGRVVIRPDSGEVIPTLKIIFKLLEERYGMETNSKGYKVLPPQVRVLQGDGITSLTIEPILQMMKENGWSADNIVFGMGGGLLQKVDRDTMSMALKCSSAIINDESVDVFKAARGKGSKRGRLALISTSEGHASVRIGDAAIPGNLLKPFFLNGDTLNHPNIYEIRQRSMPASLLAIQQAA